MKTGEERAHTHSLESTMRCFICISTSLLTVSVLYLWVGWGRGLGSGLADPVVPVGGVGEWVGWGRTSHHGKDPRAGRKAQGVWAGY